ncbi:MAG: Ig-like domain-containing protein [Blastocatellia bacterium]|nr:Ig-like domain-containing protein [Blastocatellia bacterium]
MANKRTLVAVCVTLAIAIGCAALVKIPAVDAQKRRGVYLPPGGVTPGEGLKFRLSEGKDQPPAAENLPQAVSTPLTEAEVQAIFSRLPQLKTDPADEKDFALRERSLPPPRTGKTISDSFPPPGTLDAPDAVAKGPLEILRFSPEGKIPLAPSLSVTFSQPMVPVTSLDELAARDVPVQLVPQPPGQWRWLGTKTLVFEPKPRFPMSTSYKVTIPAGTKSAVGGSLAVAKSWTFTTPTLQMLNFYPNGGSHPRNPVLFASFDQKIDPASVLETVKVLAGTTLMQARLATPEEIKNDPSVKWMAESAQEGRYLAFKLINPNDPGAKYPLPPNTYVQVAIGPGTPSAEGPNKTEAAHRFSFSTYGPLKITDARCSYSAECTPFDQWSITFSNALDLKAFTKSQVKVVPEFPGMKIECYGNSIIVGGIKPGRKTYTVTLSPDIRDVYEQTLGATEPLVFKVGSAPKQLYSSGTDFVTLDPSGPAAFSIYSINHSNVRVRLYRVTPDQWREFGKYMQEGRYKYGNKPRFLPPPGVQVFGDVVPIKNQPDELVETRINLNPALNAGLGNVIVAIEPTVNPYDNWQYPTVVWVQSTKIGLDAFVDGDDLLGWATSLTDGRPLEGVQLTLTTQGATAVTGADGIGKIGLTDNPKGVGMLVARKGTDMAFLLENASWWYDSSSWSRRSPGATLKWYVFDDRKMYKPGEEVHLKGWARRWTYGKRGDIEAFAGAAEIVNYVVRDVRGNEITKGRAQFNVLGGFDFAFKLPGTMNLGTASIELTTTGGSLYGSSYHQFQVQEFRRPEFEVSSQVSDGPFFIGDDATVTVSANYYAGGVLSNADVTWNVRATQTSYTPPNWGEFTFGSWTPWWWYGRSTTTATNTQQFTGKTDAGGKHRVQINFDSVAPPRASSVTAEATVMDVNRQAWTTSSTLLVHPADLYVGLKTKRTFVQKGDPMELASIVTDIDGKAIAGRTVKIRAVLLDWAYEGGTWAEKEVDVQECEVKSGTEPVQCRFTAKGGGQYRITATVLDDRERLNETVFTIWVAGGKHPPEREVKQEQIELIPNQQEYQPGDTAEILVQAPFTPAEGILTVQREGILYSERFKITGFSHTLKIPIKDEYIPNLNIQVDLVGAATRANDDGSLNEKLPKRPAFAVGSLNLSIPPHSRTLNVTATPKDKALEPGGETSVAVEIRDAKGLPVSGGEVAVVVVDESILALTGYRLADPVSMFYGQRGGGMASFHLRSNILLSNPEDALKNQQTQAVSQDGIAVNRRFKNGYSAVGGVLAGRAEGAPPPPPMEPAAKPASAPMAEKKMAANEVVDMAVAQPEANTPIKVRSDFNPLATFAPALPTDSDGRVVVNVKVPDNLTRYRIMAVAVAGGKQFGSGESTITARMPLMVRPSAPRFLNFGDAFELPVVLQNQTDNPMEVKVVVRAGNAKLTEGAGKKVTVPANDRVEVRFPTTTEKPGTARFQFAGVSGKWADSAEIELPVWTPATTEAFATYGEVDEGALVQPVQGPANVYPQFGGLEITTSSTQLQALTDAVLYLSTYKFECAEQISSRLLAIASLKDVLSAFQAKGLPAQDKLLAKVKEDIKRLQLLQNGDGGFSFWRRNEDSWPYLGIHVAHALQRAKEKGFAVPDDMLNQSKNYLRNIESKIPSWYSIESRRALIAYALYVRNRMGDKDPARARKLIQEATLEKLSLETVGWLLSVLSPDANSKLEVAAIRKLLANRVTETAAAAHFVTSYSDGDYVLLHSDRRADGIILEALILDQPTSDLIPKIVRGLLAHRTAGRWESTQETCWVLLALDRYFNVYEKVTPNFTARAWVGQTYAGEHDFKGRTTEYHQINVPMRYLLENMGVKNLILQKEGAGRLYYRVGMTYAPTDLKLKPRDAGFSVQRQYEAVDDPKDVTRMPDGTWQVKAGARVRVRLTMVAPTRRYHVALVDPLPAGLETLNPELAVTGSLPADPNPTNANNRWWWTWTWYQHQNFRDERTEAFTTLLWEGVHNYTYVTRATTPGNFVVPPAKAEEMYHPETFGRSGSDRVVVK